MTPLRTDSRVAIIEGRPTLVVDRRPPLPPMLELLLAGGRDVSGRTWSPLRLVVRNSLRLGGARTACLAQEHRTSVWLQGFHTGSDGIVRYLSLDACIDCGAVCIRDRSVDVLPGLPTGGRSPRRKDHVIAWYSGARPSNRTYGRNLS